MNLREFKKLLASKRFFQLEIFCDNDNRFGAIKFEYIYHGVSDYFEARSNTGYKNTAEIFAQIRYDSIKKISDPVEQGYCKTAEVFTTYGQMIRIFYKD